MEGRLCRILTSGDEVNDIPDIGNRVNKDMGQGSVKDVGSTLCNKEVLWEVR